MHGMTADEYLKQDVGALLASVLFQLAKLKAENEKLRLQNLELLAATVAANGTSTETKA